MFHYVYKTTQKSIGKFYIGKHSTTNLDDGYMGSGVDIAPLIKENPDDFEKEILKEFSRPHEALDYEAELMSPEFLINNYFNVFN